MSIKLRKISYAEAISEAQVQAMRRKKGVFLMGLGVTDYKGIFGTTTAAYKLFGPKRVIETPASENALSGIAIGAALTGKRPILIHARNDFIFLALDQMLNAAAKWKYSYGGKSRVAFVMRGIIGKGWGQGPTHSQSIQSVFMHFPGLFVAMPSNAYDAKGILLSALEQDTPCVILEHRSLYDNIALVPKQEYRVPIGKAKVLRQGKDISVVAASFMVQEAIKAQMALRKMNISLEVLDPRFLKPLDEQAIIRSVQKTGRLIVADTSWLTCGFSSEVAAVASEKAFGYLKAPVVRIGLPECPSPVSYSLENCFYPSYKTIIVAACRMFKKKPDPRIMQSPVIDNFKGPY